MARTPIVAANWKMHLAPKGAMEKDSPYHTTKAVEIIVFPSFLDIRDCVDTGLLTGGQYGRVEANGAYTGDISIAMLKGAGCSAVLCGHSERRIGHGETSETVAQQARAALELGLHPIVCVGETAEERDADTAQKVVEAQVGVLPLDGAITIAYEPVWAIGTGRTATPDLAQEMHAYIRSLLPEKSRASTRILYGGSVKPVNAADLFAQPDIDGGLVGQASLDPAAFGEIVAAAGRS